MNEYQAFSFFISSTPDVRISSVPTLIHTAKMALVPSLSGFSRLSMVFAVAGMCFLPTNLALSQTYQGLEQGGPQEQSAQSPTHSSNLPDWAEPSKSSPSYTKKNDGSAVDGTIRPKAAPPPGGEPVPVDGGLALLAAAGAGYAVRKLREDDEKDDEEPV